MVESFSLILENEVWLSTQSREVEPLLVHMYIYIYIYIYMYIYIYIEREREREKEREFTLTKCILVFITINYAISVRNVSRKREKDVIMFSCLTRHARCDCNDIAARYMLNRVLESPVRRLHDLYAAEAGAILASFPLSVIKTREP